ncbi:MAG: winged helix-turn-helix domain-containing protein [Holophagae bacterium]
MSSQVESAQKIEARFLVGDQLVEPTLNRVVRDGSAVQISFKAMDLLICLAERAGEVVDKRELVDLVWQTEYVADNTVTRRIAELRDAFGDDARNPLFIETITKRGYRLIAEVRQIDGDRPDPTADLDARCPDEASPYPGLAPFTDADADNFFGREPEIASLWRKITNRRLLAVIGPSGAGKSSLLRAGVVARAPPGWRAVVCHPGDEPFMAVARTLAPDLAGDADEMRQLLGFRDPDTALAVTARWRGRWSEALLVVDQFEELFTVTPEPVRTPFVALLRRLVDAARVHVVLVLRDDFLFECHRSPELAPIFADLTPVGPPEGPELRRALTEPAARHMVVFDSETLVDEMVAEVEHERGALPLLAFAMARMWELRDRDRRMLTRESYETIGGVGGALARHAEATLEVIGHDRLPIVRELFRNLVTAQGTRAVREVDDLLSVFDRSALPPVASKTLDVRRLTSHSERSERSRLTPHSERSERSPPHVKPARDAAEEVLRELVDARLLTSFEERGADDEGAPAIHRVEIVHESLLRSWPRLVRWQTQDADAAQLRDQLRQAARLWMDRGRPGELLWTGASYREFALWRERYPGGLSAEEQAFADAMVRHAGRRRRRRRLIGAAVVVFLAAVAAALAALWLRSERQSRRIEARRLEEIARQTMGVSPPNALAHALASLEISDSLEARRLALEAVQSSPMPLTIGWDQLPALGIGADFSPDGRWLAVGHFNGELALWSRDGGPPTSWRPSEARGRANFSPDSKVLLSRSLGDPSIGVWSVPDLRRLGTLDRGGFTRTDIDSRTANVQRGLRRLIREPEVPGGWRYDLWALDRTEALAGDRLPAAVIGPAEDEMVIALGDELQLHSSTESSVVPRVLARLESKVDLMAISAGGDRLATVHGDGEVRLWALGDEIAEPQRVWPRIHEGGCNDLRFAPSGSHFAVGYDYYVAALLGVHDPPGSDPLLLLPDEDRLIEVGFHPSGDWLATASMNGVSLWPLDRTRYPFILRGHAGTIESVAFGPDGRWLVSQGSDGVVRRWPLDGAAETRDQVVYDWGHPAPILVGGMTLSPDGEYLVTTCNEDVARLVTLDGTAPMSLGGFDNRVLGAKIGGGGRFVAISGRVDDRWVVRLWDLETETTREIDVSEIGAGGFAASIVLTADGRLLTMGSEGTLHEIDSAGASSRIFAEGIGSSYLIGRDDDLIVSRRRGDGVASVATIHDLSNGTTLPLSSHGELVVSFALDPSGSVVVTGSRDGIVRVGPVSGESPHWLVGHVGRVFAVAVSPDGRWVASGADDGTIRLWPMPDLSKPPLHDLPRGEFLDRLGSLINRRVIRDPDDPESYRIKVDPFPGWATVPEW